MTKKYPTEIPTEGYTNLPEGATCKELDAAFEFYIKITLPEVIEILNNECNRDTSIERIIAILHDNGVNLRNLGSVFLRASDDLKPTLLLEMVSFLTSMS